MKCDIFIKIQLLFTYFYNFPVKNPIFTRFPADFSRKMIEKPQNCITFEAEFRSVVRLLGGHFFRFFLNFHSFFHMFHCFLLQMLSRICGNGIRLTRSRIQFQNNLAAFRGGKIEKKINHFCKIIFLDYSNPAPKRGFINNLIDNVRDEMQKNKELQVGEILKTWKKKHLKIQIFPIHFILFISANSNFININWNIIFIKIIYKQKKILFSNFLIFQEHQQQLKARMQELNESDALKDARKKFVRFLTILYSFQWKMIYSFRNSSKKRR